MNVNIEVPSWATKILSDLTDMERNAQALNAKVVSKFSLTLPDDVYFEYGFINKTGELVADPLNPLRADNPWYPNISAVLGPNYKPSAISSQKAQGLTKRLRPFSEHLQETKRIITYTPKGFEQEALSVVYLQDGVAYYRIAQLSEVLEQLIAEGKAQPAHLVFIEPRDRNKEYRYDPDYRAFVTQELIPVIEQELKVKNERILMGASLGGLVSASLALYHPDLFSTVVSQSGAFLGSPEDQDVYTSKTSWVLAEVQKRERLNIRWYLETGTLEWLISINRELRDALQTKGYDFKYQERNAGHNWTNWRNGLADALEFALSLKEEGKSKKKD